jgi:glutathione S-transferase
MALRYAGIAYELREVLLNDKPPAMLQASAKGTVPVMCLPDGRMVDESIDVMVWALQQNVQEIRDPENWYPEELREPVEALVNINDQEFKTHLDHYKYWERFPQHPQTHYRQQAESFLLKLEQHLSNHRFLLAARQTLADIAIFPFVRQFAFVDKAWFDQAPYPRLQDWLQHFLQCSLFLQVMQKHPLWQEGDAPLLISHE